MSLAFVSEYKVKILLDLNNDNNNNNYYNNEYNKQLS